LEEIDEEFGRSKINGNSHISSPNIGTGGKNSTFLKRQVSQIELDQNSLEKLKTRQVWWNIIKGNRNIKFNST